MPTIPSPEHVPDALAFARRGRVWASVGELFRPNYITAHFPLLLEQNGLRKIRFHDLRHTCASLLLSQNVNMKIIQMWLGHSSMKTTADIYAHLDSASKNEAGKILMNLLGVDGEEE